MGKSSLAPATPHLTDDLTALSEARFSAVGRDERRLRRAFDKVVRRKKLQSVRQSAARSLTEL